MAFWVYILASKRNSRLYAGHTDHLPKRIGQHQDEALLGFTSRYGVKMLVWFEEHSTRDSARNRERQIKEWRRAWKLRLIEMSNPEWKDLSRDLNNWYPYN